MIDVLAVLSLSLSLQIDRCEKQEKQQSQNGTYHKAQPEEMRMISRNVCADRSNTAIIVVIIIAILVVVGILTYKSHSTAQLSAAQCNYFTVYLVLAYV